MTHLETAHSQLRAAVESLVAEHYEPIAGSVCSALYHVGKAMAEEGTSQADVMKFMLTAEGILRELAKVADEGRRSAHAIARASEWGERKLGEAFFTSAPKKNRRR